MKPESPIDLIRQTRWLLTSPSAWQQGSLGDENEIDQPHCMFGGLLVVSGEWDEWLVAAQTNTCLSTLTGEAGRLVGNFILDRCPDVREWVDKLHHRVAAEGAFAACTRFNDTRSHAQVLALLDSVLAEAVEEPDPERELVPA